MRRSLETVCSTLPLESSTGWPAALDCWAPMMRSTLREMNCGATPAKNHSLSFMMGPPSSAPKSRL